MTNNSWDAFVIATSQPNCKYAAFWRWPNPYAWADLAVSFRHAVASAQRLLMTYNCLNFYERRLLMNDQLPTNWSPTGHRSWNQDRGLEFEGWDCGLKARERGNTIIGTCFVHHFNSFYKILATNIDSSFLTTCNKPQKCRSMFHQRITKFWYINRTHSRSILTYSNLKRASDCKAHWWHMSPEPGILHDIKRIRFESLPQQPKWPTFSGCGRMVAGALQGTGCPSFKVYARVETDQYVVVRLCSSCIVHWPVWGVHSSRVCTSNRTWGRLKVAVASTSNWQLRSLESDQHWLLAG